MNFIGHTVDLFDTKNLPPNCVSAEIDSKFLNWTYLTQIKSLQSITHMRTSHQAIISDTQRMQKWQATVKNQILATSRVEKYRLYL